MDKKYQIFVSSTYEDLKEERQAVVRAILEMGHIPVGMEMFSAADEEQWEIIKRAIDTSDYYVVIVARRYGSTIPSEDGVSYTEKEWRYAKQVQCPVLGFLLDENVAWEPSRTEPSGKNSKSYRKLKDFKDQLRQRPVSVWKSMDDLRGQCAIALGKAFNTQPRDGWIKASKAVKAEDLEEISRLSRENEQLRARLQAVGTRDGSIGDEEYTAILEQLKSVEAIASIKDPETGEYVDRDPIAIGKLFQEIGSSLHGPIDARDLSKLMGRAFYKQGIALDEAWPVGRSVVDSVMDYLAALDLVESAGKPNKRQDVGPLWRFSDFGRRFWKTRLRKLAQKRVEQRSKT